MDEHEERRERNSLSGQKAAELMEKEKEREKERALYMCIFQNNKLIANSDNYIFVHKPFFHHSHCGFSERKSRKKKIKMELTHKEKRSKHFMPMYVYTVRLCRDRERESIGFGNGLSAF